MKTHRVGSGCSSKLHEPRSAAAARGIRNGALSSETYLSTFAEASAGSARLARAVEQFLGRGPVPNGV